MTFNVLHDAVRTLSPGWSLRRGQVVAILRSARADVVCLQEVSPRQLFDITRELPEYQVVPGVPSGGTTLEGWASTLRCPAHFVFGDFFDQGEQCPILVRRGFGRCVDTSTLRLQGTRTMGVSTPHIVNWVRIKLPSGRTIGVYNTHLGLVRGRVRGVPADLIRLLDAHRKDDIQILAGDFNTRPSGGLLRALTTAKGADSPAFIDTWAAARARVGGKGTFHWGLGLPGPRIDYILVRPSWDIPRAEVLGGHVGSVFPSDHYALLTELEPTHVASPRM